MDRNAIIALLLTRVLTRSEREELADCLKPVPRGNPHGKRKARLAFRPLTPDRSRIEVNFVDSGGNFLRYDAETAWERALCDVGEMAAFLCSAFELTLERQALLADRLKSVGKGRPKGAANRRYELLARIREQVESERKAWRAHQRKITPVSRERYWPPEILDRVILRALMRYAKADGSLPFTIADVRASLDS